MLTRKRYAYPKRSVRVGENFQCTYCLSKKLKNRSRQLLKLLSSTVREMIEKKTAYSKDEFVTLLKETIQANKIIDYEPMTPVE
jgi:hypothetical protein